MDKEFWLRRWAKNEIGFHNSEPHPYLLRFFPFLHASPGDPVFVPLCGKSPDLVWLQEEQLNVVGIELSRTAVEAFFAENKLAGEWTILAEKPCCCAEGYKIFCGDFFQLAATDISGARSVYDRGSLVALPPAMRSRYAAHLAALLPSGSRVLLVSYEYDQQETAGPPFSVNGQELEVLLGDDFQVELLVEEDTLGSHQGLAARGVTRLTEFAVLLVRR
jgi:thiopurine S-methyltransferase